MQHCQLLLALTRNLRCDLHEKGLKHGAAKTNKPPLQYDVFIDICMLSTCRFSPLLRLTPELPVLFLEAFTADYAVMFPSGH